MIVAAATVLLLVAGLHACKRLQRWPARSALLGSLAGLGLTIAAVSALLWASTRGDDLLGAEAQWLAIAALIPAAGCTLSAWDRLRGRS